MILQGANPLNASELIFPTLEVFHIVGFAMCVGTIALVDFRLLGVGMNHQKTAEVAQDVAPWTLVGLALILLFGSFYISWSFLVFPLWVFLISASILRERTRPVSAKRDGQTNSRSRLRNE